MTSTAIRKETREPVHVSDVDRGLACKCICNDCDKPLIARKGDERAHHFAHQGDQNSTCLGEGNLHKYAKKILKEEKRLTLRHPETNIIVQQSFDSAEEEVPKRIGG